MVEPISSCVLLNSAASTRSNSILLKSFFSFPIELDAHDMSVIESNSMDVVTCCYGFMFCAEPEKAFSEVARVLKPGGRLITTVWVEFPIMSMVRNIMTEVLGIYKK